MIVHFSCYDCGQRYQADRSMAGRVVTCRRCGWPMKVPKRDAKQPSPARAGDEPSSQIARS